MNCLTYCSSFILWFPRMRYSFWMSKKCLEVLSFMKFFQPMVSWLLAKLGICGDMHPISTMFLVPRISTYLGIQYASSLSLLQSFSSQSFILSVDSRNNLVMYVLTWAKTDAGCCFYEPTFGALGLLSFKSFVAGDLKSCSAEACVLLG